MKVFKNVFNREESVEIDFLTFVMFPNVAFNHFGLTDFEENMTRIKNIKNKVERNEEKRKYIPAANFKGTGIFCIDIDNLENNPEKKRKIIEDCKDMNFIHCIKESPSGNLCLFIKHKYDEKNFKFGYYKYYLKLTLNLEVNIDFLPDLDRLRYLTLGEVYLLNKDSIVVDDIIVVDNLPTITMVYTKNGKKIKYGSR